MAKFRRINTTVPQRTLGSRKVQAPTHAIYLRMSFLAMERRRRQVEVDNMQARLVLLRKRISVIDKELETLIATVGIPTPPVKGSSLPPGLAIRY